jgi:hypothetical protein
MMVSGNNDDLNRYYVEGFSCVLDAEPIVIFNAGKASLELKKILEIWSSIHIFLV